MSNLKKSSAYQVNLIALPWVGVGCILAGIAIYAAYPQEISLRLGTACFALGALVAGLSRWAMPRVQSTGQLDVVVFFYQAGIVAVQWLSLSLNAETESPGGALLLCAFGGLAFHSPRILVAFIVFCSVSWLAIRNQMGIPPTLSLLLEFLLIVPLFVIIVRQALLKTYCALTESQSRELSNVKELTITAARLARETQLRKESELTLLHAQKNESLGVLAAGVAHDFNNSLLAISAFAENIQLTTDAKGTRESATQIMAAVQQASSICGQMMTYAGKPTGELERVSLCKIVTNSLPLLQATAGARAQISTNCLPIEGAITANETQMQQVLMNLVTNAVEAMSEPGDINIKVTKENFDSNCDDMSDDYIGSPIGTGKYIQLEVTDSGCGMPEDVVSQVFDPYFTTKESGHGFGLSTVLGIVRSHKATMTVNSSPDSGTTMRILFPADGMKFADSSQFRTPRGPRIEESRGVKELSSAAKNRVLVIDDDEMVRTPMSQMLTLLGWDVLAVDSGSRAIKVIKRGDQFTAFLIDFEMPRLNGHETLKAIRELGCDTPAILCSGFISEPEQASVLADFDGFLPKPFHRRDLEEKLAGLAVDNAIIS